VLSTATAHADPESEPVRVDYSAPTTCPGKEAFLDGILGRTARARRANDTDRARVFVVAITEGGQESRGHLAIRAPDGAETEREVVGDTCEEVVSALALIAALAIDPHAKAGPTAAPVTPPTAAPLNVAQPITPARAESPPHSEGAGRETWHLGTSVGASVTGGIGPQLAAGGALAIQLVAPRTWPVVPGASLGFERASSDASDSPRGTATFTWTVGFLEVCPLRGWLGPVSLAPCARFEAGTLTGVGYDIVPSRSSTQAWAALGGAVRAEWSFAGPLFVSLEGGLRAPFVQPTFFFEPDSVVYRPPDVAGAGSASLGAYFL